MVRCMRPLVVGMVACLGALFLHGAEMPEPISYTLRFPAPETHLVEVEGRFPTHGRPTLELAMAVWTPGSYLVREFARNLEGLSAAGEDGRPLAVEKTAKNRWRIATGGEGRAVVRYRLYAREMSVRSDFVDASFALINGAPTFLAPLAPGGGLAPAPYEVRLVLPPAWKTSVSALAPLPGVEHGYRAEDFDTLVDSPLYAGNPEIHRFEAGGRPHLVVDEGAGGEDRVWDGARAAADLARLVEEEIAFWGGAPYSRYVFFNLITEESGGLEHKGSTVLMTSRWKARTREGRLDWLSLAGHELFHAWNVKRLRPVELDRFDYEHETYTEGLWMAEGLTSYYDDLLLPRAGLATREEYLKRLSKQIDTLQGTPGRLVQSLRAASFDAWIKYYRRDENFVNTGTSYYTKGAVVGFLLDARIRRATRGERSLDDVLRLAWRRYSGERGFTEAQLRQTVEEVAGRATGEWLERAVGAAEELDYQEALDWLGLRFTLDRSRDGASGDEPDEPRKEPSGWLGIETEVQKARLTVTEVKRGTPAYQAGVNVGDEILAIGDYRVPPESWAERLKAYRPGERATLLVARRERLTRLPVVFGEKPPRRWKLEVDPKATAEQKAHLAAWLRSHLRPAEPAASGIGGFGTSRKLQPAALEARPDAPGS
jgi:predicted metalloprotease with PDZ domain